MTQPPARLPSHLLPRPKAAATSSSTSLDALARPAGTPTPRSSRDSSRHPVTPSNLPPSPADISSKATTVFVRRVLCPRAHESLAQPRPLHEVLPPLTSSNDVDLQLYAIIAVVMKEFVYSWYGKITPDESFVEETIQIIAHCTRDLEQRLRRVDVEALLLDEIPELVRRHIVGEKRYDLIS